MIPTEERIIVALEPQYVPTGPAAFSQGPPRRSSDVSSSATLLSTTAMHGVHLAGGITILELTPAPSVPIKVPSPPTPTHTHTMRSRATCLVVPQTSKSQRVTLARTGLLNVKDSRHKTLLAGLPSRKFTLSKNRSPVALPLVACSRRTLELTHMNRFKELSKSKQWHRPKHLSTVCSSSVTLFSPSTNARPHRPSTVDIKDADDDMKALLKDLTTEFNTEFLNSLDIAGDNRP
jgi:hypothetical protein